MLRAAGHRAILADPGAAPACDLLVALHARKSAAAVDTLLRGRRRGSSARREGSATHGARGAAPALCFASARRPCGRVAHGGLETRRAAGDAQESSLPISGRVAARAGTGAHRAV